MASLRNAVKRKTHKERAQPAKRAKFGLLEKAKDYRLRAKDYRRKKGRLRVLKQKAEFKNPDEFYFSMNNKKTKDGVHLGGNNSEELNAPISADVLNMMRTQDGSYVQTKINEEASKIEKLQSNLAFLSDNNNNNKHTLFVNSREEIDNFSPTKYFDTVDELSSRAYNRPRKKTLAASKVQGTVEDNEILHRRQMKKLKKRRDRAYRELNERIEREEKLQAVAQQIDLQRNLSGKGRRKKIKDGNGDAPPVYRWKRERKR